MVGLKLRRATPALPERSWQKTNISLPQMKVKRDGFDGETDNLAGREGMCTRRVKPTQKSAGKSEDERETGTAERRLGARTGGGILAGTRTRPKVQEAGKGSCGHRKPE